jgi:hypothetical protein
VSALNVVAGCSGMLLDDDELEDELDDDELGEPLEDEELEDGEDDELLARSRVTLLSFSRRLSGS